METAAPRICSHGLGRLPSEVGEENQLSATTTGGPTTRVVGNGGFGRTKSHVAFGWFQECTF